ncbi:MAG: hypothetical protein Q3972_06145 [Corynebacterium sp.]|nr:hypothetical protein [Corynebacterium sp.]
MVLSVILYNFPEEPTDPSIAFKATSALVHTAEYIALAAGVVMIATAIGWLRKVTSYRALFVLYIFFALATLYGPISNIYISIAAPGEPIINIAAFFTGFLGPLGALVIGLVLRPRLTQARTTV